MTRATAVAEAAKTDKPMALCLNKHKPTLELFERLAIAIKEKRKRDKPAAWRHEVSPIGTKAQPAFAEDATLGANPLGLRFASSF